MAGVGYDSAPELMQHIIAINRSCGLTCVGISRVTLQ